MFPECSALTFNFGIIIFLKSVNIYHYLFRVYCMCMYTRVYMYMLARGVGEREQLERVGPLCYVDSEHHTQATGLGGKLLYPMKFFVWHIWKLAATTPLGPLKFSPDRFIFPFIYSSCLSLMQTIFLFCNCRT